MAEANLRHELQQAHTGLSRALACLSRAADHADADLAGGIQLAAAEAQDAARRLDRLMKFAGVRPEAVEAGRGGP